MLNAADIYGVRQTGREASGSNMNPSVDQAKQAQTNADVSSAKAGSGINYGVFALLAFFGVLLGIKYGLEKRG